MKKTILGVFCWLLFLVIITGCTYKTNYIKYNEQYNNLKIIYEDTFHEWYFILDD